MKKTLLLASLACLFSLKANASEIKPYVGFDLSAVSAGLGTGYDYVVDDSYNSFTFNTGAKFNKNFALELFYQSSSEEDLKMGTGTTSFKAGGVDGVISMPTSEISNLLVSVGLANYDVELTTPFGMREEDSLANRFAIGAEYNFSENISSRFMLRYVAMSDMESVDNITEFSVGLRYSF